MGIFAPRALETSEVEQLIGGFRSWIFERLAAAGVALPVRVWLFGSGARGELTEASDLDMALVCDDESHVRAVRSVLSRSRRPFDWPVDLVYYTQAGFAERSVHGGLAWIVAREGSLIIDRESGRQGDES